MVFKAERFTDRLCRQNSAGVHGWSFVHLLYLRPGFILRFQSFMFSHMQIL